MQTQTLIDKFLGNRPLTHTVFWVLMVLLYTQVFFHYGVSFWFGFINNIVLFPSIIGAAYVLVYYQIPRFIEKKKYWTFAGSFLISAYLFTVIARLLTIYIAEPVLGRDEPWPHMWASVLIAPQRLIQNYFMGIHIAPLIMASIKMVKKHTETKRKAEALEKEKHITELNFLKAQIHPHFLFNTLNNLYTLTLQKSDQAPETVVKLSEMLDYMLYQCNDKLVPIEKEIHLLNNYIGLEKLRYGERLLVKFEESIEDPQTQIAPLMLLSIVENAFKHGVSGAMKNSEISIQISIKEQVLDMSVYNTKPPVVQEDLTAYKEGIGVSNIKRQLELLYPDRYNLEIKEDEESYLVNLNIQLQAA